VDDTEDDLAIDDPVRTLDLADEDRPIDRVGVFALLVIAGVDNPRDVLCALSREATGLAGLPFRSFISGITDEPLDLACLALWSFMRGVKDDPIGDFLLFPVPTLRSRGLPHAMLINISVC